MSDTMIMDTISSYLVLPNRLLVPLVPNLHDAARLRCPLPRVWGGSMGKGGGLGRGGGVDTHNLKVHRRHLPPPPPLSAGCGARASVWSAGAAQQRPLHGGVGGGKSDPYAVLRVGTQVDRKSVV